MPALGTGVLMNIGIVMGLANADGTLPTFMTEIESMSSDGTYLYMGDMVGNRVIRFDPAGLPLILH